MDVNQNKNPGNNDGDTPLHMAAIDGHLEVCRLILENVQDKNPCNISGATPLTHAVNNGHLEIIKLINPIKLK